MYHLDGMQDLEFKSELRDAPLARAVLERRNGVHACTIRQRDTYYRVPTGRFKKREAEVDGVAEPTEFIRYDRDYRPGPRISRFQILTPEETAERFGETLPAPWLVVEKTRELYMADGARVHLDEVDGLGRFLEIELLVTPKNNLARAHERLSALRSALAPCLGEPIADGYADLLAAEQGVR